jgi:DNA-binding NarL/FixJ family response regulator
VDDNPADSRLVELMLEENLPGQYELRHFERLGDAVRAMAASPPHCLLLDMSLPDAHGVEAVRTVLEAHPDIPIVVLTGHDDEAMALAAVRAGAQDYLVKGKVRGDDLLRAIRYSIERTLAAHERAGHHAGGEEPSPPVFRAQQVLELLRGARRAQPPD